MERRFSKRDYSQQSVSNSHSNPERHQPVDSQGRVSEQSKRRSSHGLQPRERHAKPDSSGDDNYVRLWLAQTDQETRSDTIKPSNQEMKAGPNEPRKKLQLELRSFRQAILEPVNAQQQSKLKRRHRSSSDSSLLEPVLKQEPKPQNGEESKLRDPERGDQHQLHRRKKRKTAPSDSESSVNPIVCKENFEKRARYKTREDRYEPKKIHKSEKAHGERKSKKKREKKGDKKRESKKAAENLMNDFFSKSIGQGRLTLRPSRGPGLFKNGRASSPARRRGLPDLVFSEMEFLQPSSRHQVPKDVSKLTSNARERDKRRLSREQDEISVFFKPTKAPLSETSPNASKARSSTYMSDERSMFIKQKVLDPTQPLSQSLGVPDKPYMPGQPAHSPHRLSASGRAPSMPRLLSIPDTTSRLSENTTSKVTWSETQMSPGEVAASTPRNHEYQYSASPTPEPIRASIKNTRIFRYTGIGGTPGLTSSRTRSISPQGGLCQKQLRDVQGTPKILELNPKNTQGEGRPIDKRLEHCSKNPHSVIKLKTRQLSHDHEVENGQVVDRYRIDQDKNTNTSGQDDVTSKRSQIIAETYDRESGWHKQQEPSRLEKTIPTPYREIGPLRESVSAPINRQAIAKLARVIRPATTLSVTRLPEEPSIHRGNSASITTQGALSKEDTGVSRLIDTALVEMRMLPISSKRPSSLVTGKTTSQDPLKTVQEIQPGCDSHLDFSNNNYSQSLGGLPSSSMHSQLGQKLNTEDGNHTASTNEHNQTRAESVRGQPTTLAGLPVRGPSRRGFEQPSRIHLSSAVGPGPLYFNQIQWHYDPTDPVFGNETGNDQIEIDSDILDRETVPCLRDVHYEMLGHEGHDHEYGKNDMVEKGKEFECSADYDISDFQIWQPLFHEDVEQYETWKGQGHDLGNGYEGVGDRSAENVFAMEYGLEEQGTACEDRTACEEFPMQGFWRSHRPY